MKTRFCLLIILIQVFTQLDGQDYFFRQYGPTDGLGNSFIYSLNQSDDGYLWIGTAEGLYRFNGFKFQHYTDKDSLTENFITSIYKDISGGLWMGHMNGGITYFSDNRFKKFPLVSSSITSITEADTGTTWFSTQNGGLLVSQGNKKLVSIRTSLNHEFIFNIRHLSANFYLLGTRENLYIMEYLKDSSLMKEKIKISDYPSSKVVDIIKFKEGEYFVLSGDKGIFRLTINLANLSYDLTECSSDRNGDLDNIQGGTIVRRNELWVNTMGKGILKYQINTLTGNLLFTGYINKENGLKSNEVKCLFEDTEGNIWVGMYGAGLFRLVDDNIKFLSFSAKIGSRHIYALSKDSSSIWLASDNLIAMVTAERGQISKSYPFPQALTGDRVNSIYCSQSGMIYLGFEKNGLFAFNPATEIFGKIYLSNDALENSINHITGKENILWISTKKGACKLNTLTGARKWFNTSNGLPNNDIRQLYLDSSGRVLVATTCSSIFYIGPDDSVNTLSVSGNFGLNTVISFAEDNSGSLWAATYGKGIFRFKPENILNYTYSSGLVSDYCYSLIFDGSHKILVGHKGGFSQIDTETGKIRNYISNEGIKNTSDFYPNSVISDNQNNVWFGTSEGLIKLLSKVTAGEGPPPKLHIDAIYINKIRVRHDDNISLKPGNYEIRVDYTGINLSNPEIVNYQTFLEGYSAAWSDLTTRRSVVYEKVGYGKYVFKLRAFNEDNITTQEPVTFKVRIRKPVYLSIWFYLGIIALTGFSLYKYIGIREKNMKTLQERLLKNIDEKTKEIIVKEEIIKERKKIEKELIAARDRAELSDKLKSSFLTNMSHEIRTPMNAIVGLSELLRDSAYSEDEKADFVNIIVSNSHSLLGLIDDILDISKIESGQLNINIRNCDVCKALNELFQRFTEEIRSRDKSQVDFQLSIDNKVKDLTFETDIYRLKQALGKLLDNAVKFTDSGHITLGCKLVDHRILFYVEDTGIGLSEDKKEIIFELFRKVENNKLRLYRGTGLGLSLSQNLIKILGGEIKVDSELNKGSRFYFTLPLKKRSVSVVSQSDNDQEAVHK